MILILFYLYFWETFKVSSSYQVFQLVAHLSSLERLSVTGMEPSIKEAFDFLVSSDPYPHFPIVYLFPWPLIWSKCPPINPPKISKSSSPSSTLVLLLFLAVCLSFRPPHSGSAFGYLLLLASHPLLSSLTQLCYCAPAFREYFHIQSLIAPCLYRKIQPCPSLASPFLFQYLESRVLLLLLLNILFI